MLNTHASQDAARQIMSAAERANVVIVEATCKRTKRGGIHKSSRAAVIRRARQENPQFANAAAVEIFYGTEDSKDTAIRFEPSEPAIYGM